MNSPFQVRLPESFRPGEFLRTPKLIRLADDARYFISLILTKTARGQVDQFGNVRLMAKYLRNIMHKHHYHHVVDALLERGAVERVAYEVGKRSFGYRLAERFRDDKHVRIAAEDPRLIDRLRLFHEQAELARQSRMKPVHFALERHQQRLTIDGDQARDIIASLPQRSNPWDCQGVLVRDIEDRDFHVNVGRFGRLSNNITSMKREIRPALRLQSEPLHHVDIRCCQPALIGKAARDTAGQAGHSTAEQDKRGRVNGEAYMMPQHGQQGKHGKSQQICDAPDPPYHGGDLDVYCELVQSGRFYDFLLSKLEIETCSNFTRDEVKKRFLADVVAKRKANRHGAEYPSDVEDTFRRLFPTVWRFVRAVNRNGWEHENLIRRLQQEESKLVIETVAAELIARHPELFVLTLHDAIFTTASGIPVVVGAFEAAFDQIGYRMDLKVA